MDNRKRIIEFLKRRGEASSPEIAKHLKKSRQAVHKLLRPLLQTSAVLKSGTTRGARYRLPETQAPRARFLRKYYLAGLKEDQIFADLAQATALRSRISANVFEILRYAFTEMLNNAVDHSGSDKCGIEFLIDQATCHFTIRDWGIGIYQSIASKFSLDDETAAAIELMKGKTTTMAKRHSGEGVFFTSKAGDKVAFRSHHLSLSTDNLIHDIFIEKKKQMKGTEVTFTIAVQSNRKLPRIFSQYAPEEYDYRFDRTRVQVKLLASEYVSRSEAKRLLGGLDKFREVVLDLGGVRSIGQGFADEVFRVFAGQHPNLSIRHEKANPVVAAMIKHVVDNKNI